MNLDNTLFDAIQLLAEKSPRRRMHYDLRTEADVPASVGHENWKDMSQRILNVMMPDTDVPIHKHSHSSETIIICRGKVRCECYAEDGTKISEHVLEAGDSDMQYYQCVDIVSIFHLLPETLQMDIAKRSSVKPESMSRILTQ